MSDKQSVKLSQENRDILAKNARPFETRDEVLTRMLKQKCGTSKVDADTQDEIAETSEDES